MPRFHVLARALLLLLALGALAPAAAQAQQSRCFPESGQCLSGRFLDYWERNGGLSVFGFPITAELWEDGRTVQYFERNRFEAHPENAAPYDVLLGQLGVERLRADGREWRALPRGRQQAGCLFFGETGHSLCGRFRAYWEQHGGLAVFGLPISEPTPEVSEADGQTRTVQYFERNRFEAHPENAAPYDVLLGLLGSWRAGWLLGEARGLPPAPARATISGPGETLAPLTPLTLTVNAPGYDGPAELRLFDGAGWPELRRPLTISGGAASVALTSGGALGTHPALLLIDGRVAGIASAAYTLDAQTTISTGLPRYDELWPRIRAMLEHDTVDYTIDGQAVHGYRSPDSNLLWLRDHVYQSLGYRYSERDMTSALDAFRRAQQPNGAFDDYLGPDGATRGRVAVEADLEFLFVQGAYQAWQATGDDAWLRAAIPAMERGLAYLTSDPLRWEPSLGLVKRPFTIDMWDFEYGGQGAPRRSIDGDTRWSVMHGDNTGLAYAMTLMARLADARGDAGASASWRAQAAALMQRLNNTSWNGRYFVHQVHLSPVIVPGLNENTQLSLSNAYALNRDVLTFGQATAILNEYQRRRETSGAFAEWFSIDPPFPSDSFGSGTTWGDTPGGYANGGIMPLVGGELARGAFRWGQEGYGFDILRRYQFLISSQNGSYLWYYPAGNPGISGDETIATDGWGASAMLAALIEGAAGVTDRAALYRDVEIAPRWAADADVTAATVTARYGASLGYAAYRWERLPQGLRLQTTGSGDKGMLHILLPPAATDRVSVTAFGTNLAFRITTVGQSRYIDLPLPPSTTIVEIGWR